MSAPRISAFFIRLQKFILLVLVPFLYSLDQISKQLVCHVLSEGQSLPVLPGVFHLTRVDNTGVAFGLFRGIGGFLAPLTALSIAVVLVCLLKNWDRVRSLQRMGWLWVVGGALGNLHDRLVYRHVIDFLDFRVWPVFNLADSFVCVGVFLVALSALRRR